MRKPHSFVKKLRVTYTNVKAKTCIGACISLLHYYIYIRFLFSCVGCF